MSSATCNSRARRRAALRTTSRQRAEGAAERSSSQSRTQRRSTPAGWISMPMERGEAMGKPGRGSGPTPQRGIHRPARSGFPAPSPPRQRPRSEALHRHDESPWEKRGPAGPPPGAALAASQHRDRADPSRLQLAGHREGREQGHQAGLLHRPTAAADVDRDAGL